MMIDRSDAVRLARLWLDTNYPPLTPNGITTIAEAVIAMDNALSTMGIAENINPAALRKRIEGYFWRVRKLGGDTGECSAKALADWLLWIK